MARRTARQRPLKAGMENALLSTPYDIGPTLCWIDAVEEHLADNPESPLSRMRRPPEGGLVAGPGEDAYAWRRVLDANRRAGDRLPRPWLPIYYAAILTMFDRDQTVLVERAIERDGTIRVDWSHVTGLNVDVMIERHCRSTCSICGAPGRTVHIGGHRHATRCDDHANS